MQDDMYLIEEVLKGSIECFNILIMKYEKAVLRFAYNITGDVQTSEDVAQEVFITVYNRLYTFRQDSKFTNWLFKIVKNKCTDYMRKMRGTRETNMEAAEDLASKEESPEQLAEYRETGRLLEEFVGVLGNTDRQILSIRYLETSMTFSDVAQVLNMSESSVKKRFYRMRDRFKSLYQVNERSRRV